MRCLLCFVVFLAPALARAQPAPESLQDAPDPYLICELDDHGQPTKDLRGQVGTSNAFCQREAKGLKPAAEPDRVASSPAKGIAAAASWQGALVTGLGELLAKRSKAEVEAWFEDLVREKLCAIKSSNGKVEVPWFRRTCELVKDKQGTGSQLASSLVADAVRGDLLDLTGVVALHLAARPNGKAAAAALTAMPVIAAAAYDVAGRSNPLILLRDLSSRASVRKACVDRATAAALTPACALVFAGIAIDHYGSVINLPRPNGALDRAAIEKLVKDISSVGRFRCDVVKAMSKDSCSAPNPGIPAAIAEFFTSAQGLNAELLEKLLAVFQDMVDINDLVAVVKANPELSRTKALLAKIDTLLGHIEPLLWEGAVPVEEQALRGFLQASLALSNRDYAAAVRKLVEVVNLFKDSLPEGAGRLLPLIVDLADAEDSSKVAEALERAAAPIGSWRLKRQRALWSITGLVGGAAGYERALDDSTKGGAAVKGGLAAGLMAPVGLQMSTPLADGSASLGLLFSVLDVGQVTWTRLTKQQQTDEEAGTDQVPEATFAKVFSPGAYLTLGIGDSPFTFGVGASYAPVLRSYTYELDGAERAQDVSVVRLGIFAAIDVTLWPF